jgi:hypothetical protein
LSQNHLVDTGAVYSVLWYFVHGRNKALRPNLLDTRREKIIAILVNSAASFLNGQLADPLADKILAALDK